MSNQLKIIIVVISPLYLHGGGSPSTVAAILHCHVSTADKPNTGSSEGLTRFRYSGRPPVLKRRRRTDQTFCIVRSFWNQNLINGGSSLFRKSQERELSSSKKRKQEEAKLNWDKQRHKTRINSDGNPWWEKCLQTDAEVSCLLLDR